MGMIRPITRRQPREAAAGIRVHPRLYQKAAVPMVQVRCLVLSSPPEPNSPRQSHADPNANGNHPGMTTKVLIRSLCCSSSNQVRQPFKMAFWELTVISTVLLRL